MLTSILLFHRVAGSKLTLRSVVIFSPIDQRHLFHAIAAISSFPFAIAMDFARG